LHLHESTVSRAIRQKYIKTPHGVFALRSLFVKGLTNHSGKMDSVAYVKSRIQELVAQENGAAPLTDQQLTNTLQGEGIQISRRTVAKYREELNIHSSSKRAYIYKDDVSF
jgi:RNA polymerase sigma-54 factor